MLEHPKAGHNYQGEIVSDIVGNQHGTLSNTRLAWFAGILEGEGSITLNVRRKEWKGWKGVGIDLQIQIVNTDGYIIEECAKVLEGIIGSSPKIMERGRIADRTTTDGTVWRQNRAMMVVGVSKMAHIKLVLDTIMPFMIGEKKARARLAAQFIERRLSRKGEHTKQGASWYDGYDWQIVADFYAISGGNLPPEVQGIVRDYTHSAAA
jgi:hypothetical protein